MPIQEADLRGQVLQEDQLMEQFTFGATKRLLQMVLYTAEHFHPRQDLMDNAAFRRYL